MKNFKHLKVFVGGMVVILWLLSLAIMSNYIPMIATANTVICWFFLGNLARLASDVKSLRGRETAPDTCFEDFNNAEEHSK